MGKLDTAANFAFGLILDLVVGAITVVIMVASEKTAARSTRRPPERLDRLAREKPKTRAP